MKHPKHMPQDPRYVFLREIGQGTSCVVFEAFDRKYDQTVALKTLKPEIDRAHARHLIAEARILSSLEHPVLPSAYHLGRLRDGRPFYTMERIEGQTLEQLLQKGSLSLAQGKKLLQTLCKALHYVHQKGFVHLDIKPANILLSEDGRPYLVDWGTAERVSRTPHAADQSAIDYLLKGTPFYIAPELLAEEPLSFAADQYALGVLLYQWLTDALPFDGGTLQELFHRMCTEAPVPPHRQAPNKKIPADLEAICLRLLAKRPHKRFPSCLAVADALAEISIPQPKARKPRRRFSSWFSPRSSVI